MTRWQIRPFYSEQERAKIYNRTYDHTWWPDHIERVAKTAQLLGELARTTGAQTIADLSCGDGAIIMKTQYVFEEIHFGDLVQQQRGFAGISPHFYSGPIEQTIEQIPPVDLFLCSETLEHVEDPDSLLRSIRGKARHLLLTTPCGENHARNPEHYWGWEQEDVRAMLLAAGFHGGLDCELWRPAYEHPDTYLFQMWSAS